MSMFGGSLGYEERKRVVWNKGQVIRDYNPLVWRRDYMGNVIRYANYGDRLSRYGWEIDHIAPVSLGGSDDISNLRPLHWRVNSQRGGLLRNWLT